MENTNMIIVQNKETKEMVIMFANDERYNTSKSCEYIMISEGEFKEQIRIFVGKNGKSFHITEEWAVIQTNGYAVSDVRDKKIFAKFKDQDHAKDYGKKLIGEYYDMWPIFEPDFQ